MLPPLTLEKLVVDIGKPVHLDPTDFNRETYISQDSMKPLTTFTKLKELRLFGMQDSFQGIIWETVFHNEADEGIHVLDLQMAVRPLVRQKSWVEAADVTGLSVPINIDDEYLGHDGKGILHHNYGMGEYLDDFSMRKARLASGLNATAPLPLWCLKLDGFVVDHLPFERELSSIVLLTCGEKCVDAGLRAPRTASPQNTWSVGAKGMATHCKIVFPKWAGTFDARGVQQSEDGGLAEYGMRQPPEGMSMVTNHLNSLNLESGASSPLAETPPTPLGRISNISTRGSPVPTPSSTPLVFTDGHADFTLVDNDNVEKNSVKSLSDSISSIFTDSTVHVPSVISGEESDYAPQVSTSKGLLSFLNLSGSNKRGE